LKKYIKLVLALILTGIIALVGYKAGYKEETSLNSNPSALSSADALTQQKRLAKLVFDKNTFGDCTIHDAWLEEIQAYQSSSFFGMNLGAKTIPMTAIYVVREIPEHPMQSQSLEFVEKNEQAILTGSSSQPVDIDDKRYWFFSSNTVFPPPAILKFACGFTTVNARQVK
jgi:hypothetical protein